MRISEIENKSNYYLILNIQDGKWKKIFGDYNRKIVENKMQNLQAFDETKYKIIEVNNSDKNICNEAIKKLNLEMILELFEPLKSKTITEGKTQKALLIKKIDELIEEFVSLDLNSKRYESLYEEFCENIHSLRKLLYNDTKIVEEQKNIVKNSIDLIYILGAKEFNKIPKKMEIIKEQRKKDFDKKWLPKIKTLENIKDINEKYKYFKGL